MFGEEIVFMSYVYSDSGPGNSGIALHTDGQPYGSKISGFEEGVPFMIQVLYYLDDLTPEVSPFRVVPRPHLSMHAAANPYRRYGSHPGEVMVPFRAESAMLINQRVFHGNFPNIGSVSREMLAIAYRPVWAGPQADVDLWDPTDPSRLPGHVCPLFVDRNTKHWALDQGNRSDDMSRETSGRNPSRWERC